MSRTASESAAAMVGEAVDLGPRAAPVLGPDRENALKVAELRAGKRCHGCGERVRAGFELTVFTADAVGTETAARAVTVVACDGGDGCQYALEAAKTATVMRMVEYVWLDEERAARPSEPREPEGSKMRGKMTRRARRARAAASRS